MKNIVLYGMRGCGKTTIGKKLAKKLGLIFYDLDGEIENNIGGDIFHYIEKKGWDIFRKKENEVLNLLLKINNNKVISLGGGAIIFENNQNILLKKSYKLIYIDSSIDTIYGRIQKDEEVGNKRNSLTDKGLLEELEEVYNKRKDLYESFYDYSVLNNTTIKDCLNEIIKKINFGRICVPIVNFEKNELIKQVELINKSREIKITELRIDLLKNNNITNIKDLIEKINTQIIITNRNTLEGGNFKGNFETSIQKLLQFKNYGDYFDIELIAGDYINNLKNQLKNSDKKIILSYHNFEETPSLDFLKEKINEMTLYKPDVYKVAVMPNTKKDINIIYKLTDFFKSNYKDKDFIFISMGENGMETRIEIPKKGSLLTFGSLRESSAPGQRNYLKFYNLIYNN